MVVAGSYSVTTFHMAFGLAFAVCPGFDLGSDPLSVAEQPVMPARGLPSTASAWHSHSWRDMDV